VPGMLDIEPEESDVAKARAFSVPLETSGGSVLPSTNRVCTAHGSVPLIVCSGPGCRAYGPAGKPP
jgi:hypothetical protein